MGEMGAVPNTTAGTGPSQSSATGLALDRVFLFVPFLGLLGFLGIRDMYPPLDGALWFWVAIGVCFAALILLRSAQDRAKEGKDVRFFFPITTWLAWGPTVVAAILLLNGVLDRSQVEQHHQIVADKRAVRGRWGSMTYYLEVTSWRANRGTEKLEVSGVTYGQFRVDDPATVEVHEGALAIPWVAQIRQTPPPPY
jgi:hypothetical protein